jgi:hypothetical protein
MRELGAYFGAGLAGFGMRGTDRIRVMASARHQVQAERCDVGTIARHRSAPLALCVAGGPALRGATLTGFDATNRGIHTGCNNFSGHIRPFPRPSRR